MNETVWNKLEEFPFDDPDSGLTFSDRLARENGWSKRFASLVIEEYRRFLYLCACAGHPVTPSDEVDQAWHLHLCYTESYWTELCEKTLGFPLHHGPTTGGKKERKKYHDWYERTLKSYREHFRSDPPEPIWPSTRVRFEKQQFRRIDTRKNLVLPKGALTLGVFGLLATLFLAGCISQFGSSASAEEGSSVLLFAGFILMLILITVFIIKTGGGGGKGGSGCSGGFGCGSDTGSGCGSGCGS
ncbi:MAG: hypothetical protein AAGJ79_04860 [Verrucomicrobiota bacterium]